MQKLNHYFLAAASLALLGFAAAPQALAQAETCNGDTNCSLGGSAYTFNTTNDAASWL